jgi:hypothetical protein
LQVPTCPSSLNRNLSRLASLPCPRHRTNERSWRNLCSDKTEDSTGRNDGKIMSSMFLGLSGPRGTLRRTGRRHVVQRSPRNRTSRSSYVYVSATAIFVDSMAYSSRMGDIHTANAGSENTNTTRNDVTSKHVMIKPLSITGIRLCLAIANVLACR